VEFELGLILRSEFAEDPRNDGRVLRGFVLFPGQSSLLCHCDGAFE